ncbi:MAG: GTPase ObgE [Planctomycetota bacterium]|nr:GTPase ObgE [Planctomycetota bacterium]
MFVDEVEIRVEAGKGGDGCMSFRREKYVPRGGPDGGDGGDGGSIIIRAVQGVDNLAAVAGRKHWKAKSGVHGQGSNRRGHNADDVYIDVPPGTVVRDAKGGYVLKDLVEPGDSVIAAHGGRGGKGNVRFKSATNQAPRQFTRGGEPEIRLLALELKVIADVGLIGMPNAGKSTLLARLSRARPQIADYPFTTKSPNLGRVHVSLDRTYVMADIPGLIEGAHEGVGLGHEFLRHVERTRVLVHLVEPQPVDESDPVENYRVIHDELAQYSADLMTRPQIVVVSKAELPEADNTQRRLAEELGRSVLAISAVTGQGLDELQRAILSTLDQVPAGT